MGHGHDGMEISDPRQRLRQDCALSPPRLKGDIMPALFALLLVVLGAGSASAAPIPVSNPSFEELASDVTTWSSANFTSEFGCPTFPFDGRVFTSDPIAGWVEGTPCRTGTFNPTANSYHPVAPGGLGPAVGIPDGVNVAFLASATMISQVLSTPLTSGIEYVLRVDIGDRFETDPLSSFEIRLLAGNVVLASTSNASPPDGGFATATVSFLAPSNHPNLGDPLQIQIAQTSSSGQLNVDNVSLVPEPSVSVLLLALGFAGLAKSRAFRRRTT
jgi:hypothetical protein